MARWFHDRQPQHGIPSVSLRRLLPEAQFVGCADFEVSGCTADSRRLDPGQVFVAVRGDRFDGHAFVAQAMERGAAGVVVEEECPEAGRLQVVVPDSRVAFARLCQALAGDPSASLLTLGVTGTAGASVAALLLRAVFETGGSRFGLVSRLGCSDGRAARPVGAAATTSEGLAALLAETLEAGSAGVVVEVGHDALKRRRLEGVELDAAVVTDLGGRPALDAEAVRDRRNAAARLVRQVVPGGVVVVNADEPEAELLGAVNLDADRISFGLGLERPADVTARIVALDRDGTTFRLRALGREASVRLHLPGLSTVRHALAAAAAGLARGIDLAAIVAALESVRGVPGRLEPVDEGQPFDVRVDAARLGPELQDSLAAVRSWLAPTAQIHCVFGAEGTRAGGRAERLGLAAAAEAGADRVTLTTDNPRAEAPQAILDDLLDGFCSPGRVRIEPDRSRAIALTLADAQPGDAVIIAGKGRQTFQIFADVATPFDDADVARHHLRALRRATRRSA